MQALSQHAIQSSAPNAQPICGDYAEYGFGNNGQGCGKSPNHGGNCGDA